MSEAQSARALERLYEDTTVRDELVDDEARILLEWGKAQVHKLAQKELDDTTFEEKYVQLTYLLGRINRFVGKRQDADDTNRLQMLDKLVAAAADAGLSMPIEKLAAFRHNHAALDNVAALHSLTAMLVDAHISPSTNTVEAVSIATPTTDVAVPPPNTLPEAASFMDSIKQWLSSEGNE
jgi:hypothetical protein